MKNGITGEDSQDNQMPLKGMEQFMQECVFKKCCKKYKKGKRCKSCPEKKK